MVFKDSMPPLGFTPTRVKISSGCGGLVCYEPGLYTGQDLEIDSSGTVALSEYHLDDRLESACFRTTCRNIGSGSGAGGYGPCSPCSPDPHPAGPGFFARRRSGPGPAPRRGSPAPALACPHPER